MKIAYIFFNGKLLGNVNFFKNFFMENNGDIFCADGGANLCHELNLTPNEIWGDLDSIDKDILSFYEEKNVIIKKFPKDKDFTDSELILNHIKDKLYDKIYCIGAFGGDIDHELTNINLMFKYDNLFLLKENELLFKIEKEFYFKNELNTKISFIPFSEEIKNLKLEGFKYNIENITLKKGDSLCMSNIIQSNSAKINFDKGKILCVIKK
ncbi:thiamine diphosphokinase [Parvimonas sp. D2]|uniref:thiamine diphosphokinase n=1 Tax=unclassified Parvimonas TaxID=1151464 RepID=UPI002B4A034F|nr:MULTISPECIES: thiamine diphosphokinase [unclassified Parvimonas]MEB3011706.1 thiamine diphosphokinase [Parvimonas sp. D2]MEB3087198.1 thiamine diphosphokinase [Parvimonas sp. D4]